MMCQSKCMDSSLSSSRPPVLTVCAESRSHNLQRNLKVLGFWGFFLSFRSNIVTSKPCFSGSSHVCEAEPRVNSTHSTSALLTKRRVGGIYSVLLLFFYCSQHFWIKKGKKKRDKASFYTLHICVKLKHAISCSISPTVGFTSIQVYFYIFIG